MTHTVTIEAEPLTREAYAPFGQIVEKGFTQLHSSDGQYFVELLTLQPRTGPMRRINRHFDSIQLFVPAERKPILVVVAPPYLSGERFDATKVKAFITDGSVAFTFAIGTWHIGPRALDGSPLALVNLQGERSNEEHTEEIDLVDLHDTLVEFALPPT